MKTRKRLLSILLTLVMVLGLMPGMSLTAYAADASVEINTATRGTTNYTDSDANFTITCQEADSDGMKLAYGNINITAKDVDHTIKKVELTIGWFPQYASSIGADRGTITIPEGLKIGGIVTIDGVNSTTLELSNQVGAAPQIKKVKIYYGAFVAVTGVTLNPSTAQTIEVNGKVSFSATVEPNNATDKKVKWSVGGTNADAVTLYTDADCTAGNEVTLDTATETLTVYAKGISAGSATVTAASNADSTKSASCDVTVNETQQQSGGTDVLTRDDTGRGTSYGEWSGVTKSSGAVYAGQSAGGNESIQLRSNDNNSGIVTTTSGGKATKVRVVWNSNTTNRRTLNVYGKNSAYSAASDLYGGDQGDLLGTIVCGQSTELTISGDYTYIGMRSNSGAMYLDSITIEWGGSTPATVAVTGVTLNPSTAQTIDVDNKVSFTATVDPDNATDKKVKWSVGGTDAGAVKLYSDEACQTEVGADATENLTVYAKGVSAGTATVTATSNADSNKSASCDVTVNAASEDPYAALKNTTNVITFDGKDWYLIDYDSSTVTLLSKECVAASQYNSSGSYVEYASSTVKTAVDNYYTNSISSNVKTAIVDNKMFLLTKDQANAMTGDTRKCSEASGANGNYWWLCSPCIRDDYALCVSGGNGDVNEYGIGVTFKLGVRPALKLDLSKVTFDSESRTFATAAPALDPVPYMAWDETSKTVKDVEGGCTDYTVVTDSTAAFEDGKWYVVNGEVSVASRITVTGTTNLILCDGAKLTASQGINVGSGNTLNIYGQSGGTGALVANGSSYSAGIGGGKDQNCGSVTIHGGTVTANSGSDLAAGIGGGSYGSGGIVTIHGGTVTAKGGTFAASIGRGQSGGDGTLTVAATHAVYSHTAAITDTNKTSAAAKAQGTGAAMEIARNRYMLVEAGTLHTHSFTYSATGATITATCGAANCGLTSNPTLTIVKPTLTTYGETGKSEAATLTGLQDFNTATGLTVSAASIQYYKATKNGSAYTKGDSLGTSAPTGAGDYMAEITLSSVKTGAETTGDVAASVGYTIAKAEPTAASPTDLKATYGQTLKDVTLTNPTGNTAGTWSWVDDTTTSVGNAGTNTFKANFTPTDANYNSVGNVDVTVTVSAADPATPTNLKATYGQTLADVTLPGGWAWKDRTTSVGEVGTNSFKADYTATSTNYNSKTDVDVTVTVGKANAVAATVTANSRTYDGTDKPLVNVDDSTLVGGELQYALGENATTAPADNLYTTSIPAKTDAGTYYVWYKVKADANHSDTEAKALTVTISAPAPAPSGGGGSSTTATVTIPVSSEDGKTSVNVTVQVSGSTATVTSANVDEVLKAKDVGNVTVNVESLNKTVDEVVLPAALVEKVAKAVADNGNDASGLEIKLPTGTVTFDAQTVATLAQQSNGKDLKVHLDNVSQATLTSAQQTTVKDMNALVVLDAYVTADGKRISNFNGGTATFSVPVKLGDGQTAAGVTAYFVAENGEKTEIPCAYDGKNATGTVTHFSNYVVAYDTEKAKQAEEDAKAVEDTVKALDALPAAADVKPEDKETIEKARTAYDALTDEQKAKVPADTLKKLTDAEAALKAAEPEPTPEPGKVSYDDLTEAEKKQADEIASALGVNKDTAAAMVKAAQELGVSMDTVKLSGDALAKLDVDNSDPKGTDFGKLTAQATKRTNTALTLKWTKQKKADGYLIYGNKCGKGNKMKLIKTVKKNSTVKWTQKKLKKGTYYKYMVVAYKNVNGQKMPIAASVVIHVPTKGGKVTVAKSLTVKQGKKVVSKLTVKKGKSVTVKVTENKEEKKLKIKTHRKVKFESSNPKIATVNAKGKITGKKKGKATVWAYAQNGIFKAIQVTVK